MLVGALLYQLIKSAIFRLIDRLPVMATEGTNWPFLVTGCLIKAPLILMPSVDGEVKNDLEVIVRASIVKYVMCEYCCRCRDQGYQLSHIWRDTPALILSR